MKCGKNITIKKMQEITISEKFNITVKAEEVGDDLLVIIAGGDVPHIGAVSAGIYGRGVGAARAGMSDEPNQNDTYSITDDAILLSTAEGQKHSPDAGVTNKSITNKSNQADLDKNNSSVYVAKKNIDEIKHVETITYPAHRDNFISEPVAEALSKKLCKNVVAISGIHIDNISTEEIEEIKNLVPKIVDAVIARKSPL